MKVLLIFPPKETIALVGVDLNESIDQESGSYPVLGLLYVATALKHYTKHEVEILDAPTEKIGYAGIEKTIREKKPDIVGIYFCTEYLIDSLKTAELIKKIDKNIVVIAGGPHLTIYPRETLASPYVDYGVYGEGEIAFKDLVETLEACKEPEKVEGVISKKNISSPDIRLQKVEDLDSLPIPDRTLVDFRKYTSLITHSDPITTMMTSRGCAFNCYYCSMIERSQKVRVRSATSVVAEIEAVVKLGIKDIIFFDENFVFDIKRVEDICNLIIEKKIKIRWHCRSRADMKFTTDALKKMKHAGCRMIQLGIETGTQRLQGVINKKLDLQKVARTIKMIKEAGILTYGNFLIGHPTETHEEMRQTLQFALDSGLDFAPFSNFHPLPGSVFYEKALKEGVIRKDYWHEFAIDQSKRLTEYWWPEQDITFLREFNKHAFRKFYLRPSFFIKAFLLRESFKKKLWKIKAAVKLFVLPRLKLS